MYEVLEMYLNRGPLTDESVMLVRIRVAIKVVDRLYHRVCGRVDTYSYPAYVRAALALQAQKGYPHMLEEEIEDVLCVWERGDNYASLMAQAKKLAAHRIIHHVRYGGRRDN
jgi:hypothetical protein